MKTSLFFLFFAFSLFGQSVTWLEKNGEDLTLNFESDNQLVHEIWFSSDLNDWAKVGEIAGGDGTISLDALSYHPMENKSRGFYKIVSITAVQNDLDDDFVYTVHEEYFGFSDNDDQDVITNSSNNTLTGGSSSDQLYGGIGNDVQFGNSGDDVYYWYLGDGNDFASDSSGENTLQFGEAITSDIISYERGDAVSTNYISNWVQAPNGADLKIHIQHPTNSTLSGSFIIDSWSSYLDHWSIRFHDGTIIDGERLATPINDIIRGTILSETLDGLSGDDIIYGEYGSTNQWGDDTLIGGSGNDQCYGTGGIDKYIWNFGDGNDFYQDSSTFYVSQLVLDSILTGAHLTFEYGNVSSSNYLTGWTTVESGADLRITITHSTDTALSGTVVIDSWTSSKQRWEIYIGEELYSTGSVLATDMNDDIRGSDLLADDLDGAYGSDIIYGYGLNDLLSGNFGNDILYGGNGDDSLYGGGDNDQLNGENDNDLLNGGSGDDTLNAGYGIDQLQGGSGNDLAYGSYDDDVYLWNYGDGEDYFSDSSGSSRLVFGSGIDALSLSLDYGTVNSSNYLTDWQSVENGADLKITITHLTNPNFSGSIVIESWSSYKGLWDIYFEDILHKNGNRLATTLPDSLSGSNDSNDVISGLEGNDTISGNNGNDSLYGNQGNDTLNGNSGDDDLDGGEGDDTLNGLSDNDQLVGGPGNDLVYGGADSDVYMWNFGDGHDYFYETSDSNDIRFGDGIAFSDLSFERGNVSSSDYVDGWAEVTNGADLRIIINHPTDATLSGSIVINTWTSYKDHWNIYFNDTFYENGNRFGTLVNDSLSGTSFDDAISGLAGNDTLSGNDGDDTLNGDEGSDTLNGGNGDDVVSGGPDNDIVYGNVNDDVYIWNFGDGHDYFYETSDSNDIRFGDGIAFSDLSFERGNVSSSNYVDGWAEVTNGADLRIIINHPTDATLSGSIVINTWTSYKDHWNIYFNDTFYENGNRFGTLVDDSLNGTNGADIISGLTGNDTINGNNGDDTLNGNAGNDSLNGGNGGDVISGGPGNDIVYGNANDDIYIWGYGDDNDYVLESSDSNELHFSTGIAYPNLSFERGNVSSSNYISNWSEVANGADLKITINHPTDPALSGSIVIESWTSYKDHWNIYFEAVFYENGNQFGTLISDSLAGTNDDDSLFGSQGDDTLNGNSGDDELDGGEGDDTLNGDYGSDQLAGGTGNDIANGGHGFDVFLWSFGDGEDFCYGNYRAGYHKTLRFSAGITSAMVTIENDSVSFSNYLTAWLDDPAGSDRKFIVTHPTDSTLSGSVVMDAWTSYGGYWRIEFDDGEVWEAAGIPAPITTTGTSLSETINGDDGADNLQGGAGDDRIYGQYGADLICGDEGDDYIDTHEGDDEVCWDFGDGQDFVVGTYFTAEMKKISLASGITAADVSFEKGDISSTQFLQFQMGYWVTSPIGADLRIIITHPTNPALSGSIIIDNWNSYRTSWNIYLDDTLTWVGSMLSTDGNDALTGLSSDDTIDGKSGNDSIDGNFGDDVILGNSGNDVLHGNYGNDTLGGGPGNDQVYGSFDQDVYLWEFGDGQDFFSDSQGDNQLLFKAPIAAENLSYELGDVSVSNYITNWQSLPSGSDLRIFITHPTDPSLSGSIVIDGWSSYKAMWSIYLEDQLLSFGGTLATEFNDTLNGTNDAEIISGEPGNDTINGNDGDDTINGNEGNDTLNGGNQNDQLAGGIGNDTLNGGNGDDSMDSGAGFDLMYGGAGNDEYLWAFGDGLDFIADTSGTNIIDLINGIDFPHLLFDRGQVAAADYYSNWVSLPTGLDLRITITHPTDASLSGSIVIDNWFSYLSQWSLYIDGVHHADAHLLATNLADDLRGSDAVDDVISGLSGDDVIRGYAGDDALNGDAGDDTLFGGNGNDTLNSGAGFDLMYGEVGNDEYRWQFGDGHDFVADISDLNFINLISGIDLSHLSFDRGEVASSDYFFNWMSASTGSDLRIIITHPTDTSLSGSIVIDNWFGYLSQWSLHLAGNLYSNAYLLATNTADDLRGSDVYDDIISGLAGNDVIRGYAGNDSLFGNAGNDILNGDGGDDRLDSGAGLDLLYGGAENDEYIWQFGDDHDFIADSSGFNFINLIGGIDFSHLSFDRGAVSASDYHSNWVFSPTGTDLRITITHPTDMSLSGSIVIDSWFSYVPQWSLYIEGILYAEARLLATNLADNLQGSDIEDDSIYGLAGNDVISGYQGEDILYGDAGNDTLNGGDDDDQLFGGMGDDTLNGENLNDILDSGPGNDRLYGGTHNDTYLWQLGDGHDFISDSSGDHALIFDSAIQTAYLSFDRGFCSASDYLNSWSSDAAGDCLRVIITHPTDSSLSGSVVIQAWASYRAFWTFYIGDSIYSTGLLLVTQFADDLRGTDSILDVISGGSGNDTLYGYDRDDTLNGESGNDVLYGGEDDDTLSGGSGNDLLNGENGNDALYGNPGYDLAYGGHGADCYIWNFGDGHDYFSDSSGLNKIQFGEQVAIEHLSFEYGSVSAADYALNWQSIPTGSDLRITITHASDATLSGSIVIESWSSYKGLWDIYFQVVFYVNGSQLATDFADTLIGSSEQDDTLYGLIGNDSISGDFGDDTLYGNTGNDTLSGGNDDDVLYGNEGNDTLNGDDGNDQLYGNTGNDLVYGGIQNDAYHWSFGDGHDYFYDTNGSNSLEFGASITFAHLTFEQGSASDTTYLNSWVASVTGPDLRITILHPTDTDLSGSIVIESWTSYKSLWDFYFADVLYENGSNLATEMNDTLAGGPGDDSLSGLAGDDMISGGYGDDHITGGSGNDIADAGYGFDVFFWNLGDGDDFYYGSYRTGYYKTLRLGPGITPAMVTIENDSVSSSNYLTAWLDDLSGSDRKFIITHPTDSSLSGAVVIDAWTSYGGYWSIEFEGGEVWAVDPGVYPDSVNTIGTPAGETINGDNGADTLQGAAGDDTINGLYGNDMLFGDAGFDLINTGYGNDTVGWNFGDGHDFVLGAYFTNENNTVQLGLGITPGMVAFEKGNASSANFNTSQLDAWTIDASGIDLRVVISHPTDSSLSGSIIIDGWNSYRSYWQIVFTEDGTLYSGNTLATTGNDTISGTTGDDSYQGDAGDDTLNGNSGNDSLYGNQDNDVLNGGIGDDLLYGGTGNDLVYGEGNNDSYHWFFGDGHDYFDDRDGLNTLVLGAGIIPDNLQAEKGNDVNTSTYISGWSINLDGPDLRITIMHPTDSALSGSIVIESWTTYYDHWQVQFPSGETILGTLLGTDGNDKLLGSPEADVIEGGLASDYSRGGAGDDIYAYYLYDGFDVWEDNQGLNSIRFGAGITPEMLTYLLYDVTVTTVSEIPIPAQYGEDLGIVIGSDGTQLGFIVINNWIYNTFNWRIEFTAMDPNTGSVYSAIERTQLAPEILPWDFDNDSIPDWWELQYGLDTTVGNQATDTDGDNLLDLEEFNVGSSPIDQDTDDDLLPDDIEVYITGTDPAVFDDLGQDDLDGDGLSTADEIDIGSDIVGFDTNGDGISDGVTYMLGLDPTSSDPDGDGLTTAQEQLLGTSTVDSDTDGDGSPDNTDPNPTNADVFLTPTNGDETAPTITLILPTPN